MINAGLILEGGSVRGVFTAGVLDYLMENDMYFKYVIGVSAGACNALNYVSKQINRTRNCMIPAKKKDRFYSLENIVRKRTIFDMDMIFETYPNKTYPFDYDEYFSSKIECEMGRQTVYKNL